MPADFIMLYRNFVKGSSTQSTSPTCVAKARIQLALATQFGATQLSQHDHDADSVIAGQYSRLTLQSLIVLLISFPSNSVHFSINYENNYPTYSSSLI